MEASDADVQDALLRRARKAVDAASEIVARSDVMTSLSNDLRTGSLTSRCAWCGRYRIDDDHWVQVEPSVLLDRTETTHGICEDCVAALRDAGLSR